MQIIRTHGLAVLIYIVFLIYVWEFFIDDAYITARYARNLADGYGLVFNPGDPPFEAYSNFILVLWQAVVIPLGLDPVVMTRALSVAFVLLFIALLDRYARAHAAPAVATRAAGLAVVMVVCNAPFIVWTVGGLETAVYASLLAIVVMLIGLQEAQARAGLTARLSDHWVELACVGLFLSRSEGFAVALMVAG